MRRQHGFPLLIGHFVDHRFPRKPALFTRMCSPRHALAVWVTMPSANSGWVTSPGRLCILLQQF